MPLFNSQLPGYARPAGPPLEVSNAVDDLMEAADQSAMQEALGIPAPQAVNAQASDYTLQLSDAGKVVVIPAGQQIFIAANADVAFPVGASIDLVASFVFNVDVVVTPDAGVTLNWAGAVDPGTRAAHMQNNQVVRLIQTATDVWYATSYAMNFSSIIYFSGIPAIADGTYAISDSLGGTITFQSGLVTGFSSAT